MRKIVRFAALILVIVTVLKMYDSNPTKEEYVAWISEQAENRTENALMKGLVSLVAEPILNDSTTRSDYLLFSIYESDLTDVGMEKIKVLGILGWFIPFSSSR